MSASAFLTSALFLYVSLTSALPPKLQTLNLATGEINNNTSKADITAPGHLTEDVVTCLQTRHPPPLVPSDCGYVLNRMILQEPNIFQERIFRQYTYMTEAGSYARSEWQHGHCEVTVHGPKHSSQLLTLFNVAWKADQIVRKCIDGFAFPKGGVSLIGDVSARFHIALRGHWEPESVSALPAVSVSRRAIPTRDNPSKSAAFQLVETPDPLMSVSRVLNHPAVASNIIHNAAALSIYPVHCFNPLIIHMQPAAPIDCGYVVNQIILRLLDPMRQMTFGFTDAADINLSKPEYRRWQFGQCTIAVKNNDVARVDTFRLLDVAATARSIIIQCLVHTQEKFGGVAKIGTDERGFYVYVGAPFISSPGLSDGLLLREGIGLEAPQSF